MERTESTEKKLTTPSTEVREKPERRRFAAEYKLRILAEADCRTELGQVGELLRREGLYSSLLSTWRKQREEGVLAGLTPKRRGRKAKPVAGGRLCMHFGHCEQFTLLNVDTAGQEILNSREIDPPPHEPGVLPRWLHDQGVNLVIAGGMGGRAQDIFAENGIEVVVGAPADPPESIVRSYLDGKLQPGENICDH